MISGMTAADIFVMIREVRNIVIGRWILNIYQLNGTLLFKISSDSPNKTWLVIEPGKRMHLTSLTYEREAKLRAFCKAIRKHLRDHKITDLEQHDFDRVIYLRAGPPEKQITLVIELFGGGNAILLDPKNRVISAMTYRRMRDRDIVRGAPFQFPPLRAADPRTISLEDLNAILNKSEQDVIRTLVSQLNMSGTTAEEILSRAKINPSLPSSKLTVHQRETVHQTLIDYFTALSESKLNPQIVFDETGIPERAIPMASAQFSKRKTQRYATFNEALDNLFTTHLEESVVDEIDEEYQREYKKLQRLLSQQQQHLEKMQTRSEQSRSIANAIYKQLNIIEELLSTIREAREQDIAWKEISNRLEEGKSRQIPAALILESLHPHEGRIQIKLEDESASLDIRLSAVENANLLFQRSKQLEKKVKGAAIAVEDTKKKIESLEEKHESKLVEAETQKLSKRRKKNWYEKFRWFKTKQGLLVLGGRDAGSNQQLIRKYLEEPDLFFHADFAGAPIVIVKTLGQEVTEEDLTEIAIFAVSYSRAWKAGWSAADAYWVNSDQVSLSAPSGEFLPKGSVMVRGDRNYIRNVPIRLAVGVLEEDIPIIAAGPEATIKQQTKMWVSLIPGKMKVSDAAKRLRAHFATQASGERKNQILALSIDEIIAALPPGPVDLVSI
ncbi:MAG: ribosome rescue protein RqcH [Candidatus Thorarchaeota archaeon]